MPASGKKSPENQLNGGRDVLSSMATEGRDGQQPLAQKTGPTYSGSCNKCGCEAAHVCQSCVLCVCVLCCALCAVRCVLCVVCGVRCVVCRVLCDVCCGFCVVCVCLCHGCRRGSSGIKPTSSVEALIKNSDAHLDGCKLMLKRMRTLISWPRAAKHSLAEWLTDRGSCASMLRILFQNCVQSRSQFSTIPNKL